SERVGKNRSTIANYLRLLKLDPIIQTGMRDGFLSMGHGRAIINLKDTEIQLKVYEKVIADGLSVRDTEQLVRTFQKGKSSKKKTKKPSLSNEMKASIKDFSDFFGAKIDVKLGKKGKGKLVIPFSSKEDFERLEKLIKD